MDARLEKKKQIALSKTQREVKSSIKKLRNQHQDNLDNIDFFYTSAEEAFNGKYIPAYDNKKIIGTLCINVPEELIYAVGAVPIRLCNGSFAYDQIGSEFLPAKTCSLVKSVAGSIYLNQQLMNIEPDLIVNPTTCDQKKKIIETEAGENAEIYTMEVPPTKDSEASQMYWRHSVKALAEKLQKVTGNKITKKSLKESIIKVSQAQAEFKKMLEFRKQGNIIWGTDAIVIANTYFFEDIDQWTVNLKKLNKELENNVKEKKFVCNENAPRILITGSPSIFPNIKLPLLIEESGALIVADEFCSSNRLLYDMAAVDEWNMYDMMPALADKYLKPNTCPNFTPNNDRKRKLLQMIKDFNVDGVVYQTFSGCQLFDMESKSVGNEFKNNNIPVLFVETDYNPDDSGQLSTRVEAFIDSINMKK